MVPFFSEILNKNYTPKMGHFGFFHLIKKYAETILLIDKEKYFTRSLLHSPTKFKQG